jgi:hypothetical protein
MSWDSESDGGTRALAQTGLFCDGRTEARLMLPRRDAPAGSHVRYFRLSGKAI